MRAEGMADAGAASPGRGRPAPAVAGGAMVRVPTRDGRGEELVVGNSASLLVLLIPALCGQIDLRAKVLH